ncbi:hypothetical protein COU74_03325 [Candidatus Peregrinibacteria bacterium CG10_big_fil_rev_8_21_14_0_10_36_19]|nr:MAG: hypothetical protein COU74_03325 [Candidatus Peregrinibacteria bacterium CG10_big_fil_rev_8_21_14_0_10_36_19]
MSNQAFFDQIEQNINSLISEKRFKDAYSNCIKYINLYPNVEQLIKLKKRIEEEVSEENENLIAEKIKEVKIIIKEERYAEAIKTLKSLLEGSPNNSKIKSLIIESQEGYKKQVDEQNKKFIKTKEEKLDQVLEKNPETLIPELLIIEQNNPGNKLVQDLSTKYRDKLISKKIKLQKNLLESEKYELIENLLNELEKINPKNQELQSLRDYVRINRHSEQIEEKEDYVYRSEKQLTTLIQLKKYDKAIKVAQEILSVDTKNTRIKSLLKVVEEKYYQQTKNKVIDQMIDYQNSLSILAKQNPKEFQKI